MLALAKRLVGAHLLAWCCDAAMLYITPIVLLAVQHGEQASYQANDLAMP